MVQAHVGDIAKGAAAGVGAGGFRPPVAAAAEVVTADVTAKVAAEVAAKQGVPTTLPISPLPLSKFSNLLRLLVYHPVCKLLE